MHVVLAPEADAEELAQALGDVVKMRALYDGKRERVRGSENAFLTWSGDDEFDAEAAQAVRGRFSL